MKNSGNAIRLATAALCALAFVAASCSKPKQSVDPNAYAREIDQWRAERTATLKGDDGWLTLVGLFWLKEGDNKFGSDAANDVVLPGGKAPRFAGSIKLTGGAAHLDAKPDAGITSQGKPVASLDLKTDDPGPPTVLDLGPLSFHVIKRGDRFALRVKDKENPARAEFQGNEYFPADPKWRVEARLEPYSPPKKIKIVNVLGMEEDDPSPGAVAFELNGQSYKLDALTEQGEPRLFIIFADRTSGKETYGAGRYLYADPPDSSGRTVIDFNKSYSPPCAFTRFATCPLPPEQNRLPFRVEAGEKYTKHAEH